MPFNVEIKVRLREDQASAVSERASHLAQRPPQRLVQRDTFFRAPQGRLKLREFANGDAELIYYERPDVVGPKTSHYLRSQVADAESLAKLLSAAWGVRGMVEKTRDLWIVGQTRVHLDDVQGVGSFLELEVVLHADQSPAEGEQVAGELLQNLDLATAEHVAGAYIDLLEIIQSREDY